MTPVSQKAASEIRCAHQSLCFTTFFDNKALCQDPESFLYQLCLFWDAEFPLCKLFLHLFFLLININVILSEWLWKRLARGQRHKLSFILVLKWQQRYPESWILNRHRRCPFCLFVLASLLLDYMFQCLVPVFSHSSGSQQRFPQTDAGSDGV